MRRRQHYPGMAGASADPRQACGLIQVASAVRAALGEEFGLSCGNTLPSVNAGHCSHVIGFDDVVRHFVFS